jgi:hypothetical protein
MSYKLFIVVRRGNIFGEVCFYRRKLCTFTGIFVSRRYALNFHDRHIFFLNFIVDVTRSDNMIPVFSLMTTKAIAVFRGLNVQAAINAITL